MRSRVCGSSEALPFRPREHAIVGRSAISTAGCKRSPRQTLYIHSAELYILPPLLSTHTTMDPLRSHEEPAQEAQPFADQTPENRRARRRKVKELKREAEAGRKPEAGPSGVNTSNETREEKNPSEKKPDNAFDDADFIAFTFSEPEEDADERPPAREWDKGKERASERDRSGRKRKSDAYERDDGYSSKKQRVAAASRRAPWTADVDWESCTNVAELYVLHNATLMDSRPLTISGSG